MDYNTLPDLNQETCFIIWNNEYFSRQKNSIQCIIIVQKSKNIINICCANDNTICMVLAEYTYLFQMDTL